jgi:hypothetical protein
MAPDSRSPGGAHVVANRSGACSGVIGWTAAARSSASREKRPRSYWQTAASHRSPNRVFAAASNAV